MVWLIDEDSYIAMGITCLQTLFRSFTILREFLSLMSSTKILVFKKTGW